MSNDRIRQVGYRKSAHEEVFDEALEKFVPVEGEDPSEIEIDPVEVEESDTPTLDKFRDNTVVKESDDEYELGRTQEVGLKAEEIDYGDNKGVEFSQQSDSLQQRMQKFEKVNDLLEQKGINRRYVLGKVDAPEKATVFEDGIGDYYYEVSHEFRPSDVAKLLDKENWFGIPEDRRSLATISLLGKAYPWLVHEAESESEVDSLLERALITEKEDLENENTFPVEKVEEIKSLLLDR